MYKLLLSFRYFRSRFLAIAALLAVTFGVAMLVIVLSIMGGYLVELRENIRGLEGHLQVIGRYGGVSDAPEVQEVIRTVENVHATAAFVERLAVYRAVTFRPCRLHGVEPVAQMRVGDFDRFVMRPAELDRVLAEHVPLAADGSAMPDRTDRTRATREVDAIVRDPERPPLAPEEVARLFSREWRVELIRRSDPELLELLGEEVPPACLVGIRVLLDRDMYLGDIITVVTMNPDPERPEPLTQEFVVAGAIKTGNFEQDSGTVHAELAVVKNFLGLLIDPEYGLYRVDGIRVALEDPELLHETRDAVAAAIEPLFPLLEVATWEDLRPNLLKAVLIETFLVYFIVLILVVFTGSMILLMLLLTVIEKTRDVGVLMALGATPRGVTSIFLINGLVICVLGTLLGLGLGLAFCTYINDIHDAIYDATGWSLFQAEIYQMDRIPIAFQPLDIVLSVVPPVLIGLCASLVPALWAPRRDPIRSIQYE